MPTITGNNNGPITINYEERGSGDPVVLIGGITSVLQVWDLMVPTLAERYRVITPDNRGSGSTIIAEDDGDRSPKRMSEDILVLLDGLGLDRVHLLGASMGGMLVQEFAIAHPDRLASLSICCSNVGGTRTITPDREVLEKFFASASKPTNPEDARSALGILIHPDSLTTCADNLDFYIATRDRFPHSPEELGNRAKGVASLDTYDRLTALNVPTLVMTGSDDQLVPTANSAVIHEAISGSAYVEIEKTGHIFFAERPDASSGALLDFLAKHPMN